MSDTVQLALIGLFTIVIKEYIDRARAHSQAQKVAEVQQTQQVQQAQFVIVVEKVTQVQQTQQVQQGQFVIVVDKVEEIHKATNSMKDALVLATEKEALARGIKEGEEGKATAAERKGP